MKARKKKKSLSLKRAAEEISGNLWAFLKTLPTEERNKRLDKFHKSVQAKVAGAKASSVPSNIQLEI